jgi:uncharacterized membrane protein YciS (DUF1049 family)
MDQIREYLRRPLIIGILAFVAGLLIGWMILGWLVAPVQWTNASPAELHPGYQDIWLRMAIQAYGATGDAQTAKLDYQYLGNTGPEALARLLANPPANLEPSLITQFSQAVSANVTVVPTAKPGATPTPAGGTTGKSNLTTLLVVMCVVTLVVAAAIVAYFVLQGRRRGAGVTTTPQVVTSEEPVSTVEWTNLPAASSEQAPMAQFMASYKVGDDLFDDSFSIDSPSGEFLGECGVGISETIGVGVPKKVTAFEVWLFDKNDIQTVTKVLMSAHAFKDPTIRSKLEAKGEPFQAASGGQTILETATLKLVARVVDMSYGQGALPEDSFFDSLVLELAIWQKQ